MNATQLMAVMDVGSSRDGSDRCVRHKMGADGPCKGLMGLGCLSLAEIYRQIAGHLGGVGVRERLIFLKWKGLFRGGFNAGVGYERNRA
jgi:hypothetical protein